MHGEVTTAGPLLWVLLVFGIVTFLASLYLVVDPLRRGSGAFVGIPETRWPYVVVGVVFASAYVGWWFDVVRDSLPWVGDVVVAGMLVVVGVTAAYLLRVVFPKPSDPPEEHST